MWLEKNRDAERRGGRVAERGRQKSAREKPHKVRRGKRRQMFELEIKRAWAARAAQQGRGS